MRKLMRAGAIALVSMVSSAVVAQASDSARPSSGIVITDAQIAQFKAMLKLTPAQERYWVPVEATLREISKRQAQQTGSGLIHRLTSITLDAAVMRRLSSAALPLLKSLDEDQKRHAQQVARAMGFASVASAF
jgi:zinc resistance-associated protein